MIANENTFKEMLKNQGYKMTVQRQAVLEVVAESKGEHLSPDEIYRLVKKKHPDIGLATVYRTLLLLEKIQLIYKLNFDDGCSRYEIRKNSEDHRHHHLVCTKCGEVEEVKEDLLESLEAQILKNNGFIVKDHNVKFFGYCRNCRSEKKSKDE